MGGEDVGGEDTKDKVLGSKSTVGVGQEQWEEPGASSYGLSHRSVILTLWVTAPVGTT